MRSSESGAIRCPTIEYADRYGTLPELATYHMIPPTLQSLIEALLRVASACYADRHSSAIAANGSPFGQHIGWTPHSFAASIQDMCVDHGDTDVLVTEQFIVRSESKPTTRTP